MLHIGIIFILILMGVTLLLGVTLAGYSLHQVFSRKPSAHAPTVVFFLALGCMGLIMLGLSSCALLHTMYPNFNPAGF